MAQNKLWDWPGWMPTFMLVEKEQVLKLFTTFMIGSLGFVEFIALLNQEERSIEIIVQLVLWMLEMHFGKHPPQLISLSTISSETTEDSRLGISSKRKFDSIHSHDVDILPMLHFTAYFLARYQSYLIRELALLKQIVSTQRWSREVSFT